MLHFRIKFGHDIKAFLVQYDSTWEVIAKKTTELFDVAPEHVILVHRERDGSVTTLANQEGLRSYLLGPKSARAVAGLPLDFTLKELDARYSIVSHFGVGGEEEEYDHAETDNDLLHGAAAQGGAKFTDEDYTFVSPPALDASDMVNLVVPGEGVYAVPRHAAVGSTPNIHLMEVRQDDDGTWDNIQSPSEAAREGSVRSVDYPNIYLEEPARPRSVASSGPPRIPFKEKGKGRAMPTSPLDPVPLRLPRADSLDMASDKSILNSRLPHKPTIHIPDANRAMSPIPLISNIVKKMSLEHAKAQTIGEGPPTPTGPDDGYSTLVNQLVSLIDVVTNLLDDPGVKHQIRSVWDGFGPKTLQEVLSPNTPMAPPTKPGEPKSKEIILAEGIVHVMRRVASIVEDDGMSDVEEQDGDVIWTHRQRGHVDIRVPQTALDTKTTTTPITPTTGNAQPPGLAKNSKQRLEEAKATYKAEKMRYRQEREQKRREKITSRGLMLPESINIKEPEEDPIQVTPLPPGRRASLMSAGEAQPRARSRIEQTSNPSKATSSIKPTAGSNYSPVLLPARLSHQIAAVKTATVPSVREKALTETEDAADGGSEGPGTPKPPPRPARDSTQFDFDAFMEANAWAPPSSAQSPAWTNEKSNFPTSARPSIATGAHASMLPPPHVYMQTGMVADGPHVFETVSNGSAPTPPPRPRIFSPSQTPPTHQTAGLEAALNDAFRANPAPRMSLKRNRWGDGLGGRRVDVGSLRESIAGVGPDAHPPPVYSTDGEGADDVIESGGPPRPEKGSISLNEEFKRRSLVVLHEYNVTRDRYPNLDQLINQGIQAAGNSRQMVRLAAESNPQARETFLSEEVPNVVNRILSTIQRASTPNYV